MVEKIKVWLKNSSHFHQTIMAKYLRKKSWVVFYLDENCRECKNMCWLKLYQQEMNKHVGS